MQDVTVIIPYYNMPISIVAAIKSVLSQISVAHIVVVDDCSVPPLELPGELTQLPNLSIHRHSKNCGAGAARNSGIKASKTKWIAMLDADDVFIENTLHLRLAFAEDYLENHPRNTSVTDMQYLFSCGWQELNTRSETRFIRTPLPANSAEEFASGCWWNPGSTTLALRETFEGKGTYNEELSRLEDFDWGIRFGLRGGALIVQDTIGAVVNPSLNAGLTDVSSSAEIIRKLHGGLAGNNPKIWNHLNAYLELELAAINKRRANIFKTAWHLARSLWFKPRLQLTLSPGWNFRKP